MAKWIDRTIRGPDEDYLTREDVAKLFGVGVDWLAAQEDAGVFPQPAKLTQRTVLYEWEYVVYVSLWLRFRHQLAPPVKSNSKGKLPVTEES